MEDQAGYLIVLAQLRDRERFLSYVKALPPLYQQFGGSYLAVAGPAQVGRFGKISTPWSVVVSKWKDVASIESFWQSAEYQSAKHLRDGTGDFHVVALDGEAIDGSFEAIALSLEPGEPMSSAASEDFHSAEGLMVLAAAGPSEGIVLEGQRQAPGLGLDAARTRAEAEAAVRAIKAEAEIGVLLLPKLVPR
jgi:uncharacterized protein (DUF1330 family)